ncbi:hypothetical protein CRUP_003759 [Coryphaenoides rupestris]|nr:hypothetical protein CRUP_003759 [Coryphaenoides rupestris]
MENFGSALEKNVADLTVMDVYDIAAVVVRVLEVLEVMVSRGSVGPETEELRLELDRLRLERLDRVEKEKKHKKELELVEDVWRGEAQDLLTQIAQLQEENKSLLTNLSIKDPMSEEDLQRHEGMSERERQVMKKLKEVVDKQRDEIRAKDRELTLKNEDVEALQQQQNRLMKINHDLRHKISVVEAQGKALIEQKVELEAGAQTQGQEVGALRQEVIRLRDRLQGGGAPGAEGQESPSQPISPAQVNVAGASHSGASSGGKETTRPPKDGGGGYSPAPSRPLCLSLSPGSQEGGVEEEEEEEEEAVLLWEAMYHEDMPAVFEYFTKEAQGEEEAGGVDQKDPGRPRFTLQELRDAFVSVIVEEAEDEVMTPSPSPSPDLRARGRSTPQPESGIKRLRRRGRRRRAAWTRRTPAARASHCRS